MLKWIERLLLAGGAALALWCAAILVEARFTRSVPPQAEPVRVTMTLPGDDGRAKTADRAVERRAAPRPGTVLGTLVAPTLEMSAPVLEGSDDGTLDRGAGHIEDTPFPGESGNIGIAGHRDTVFRPLEHAKAGDPLELKTAERTYHYTITKTLIVDPKDVYVLDPTESPTLTLVTCYPFRYVGHAPRRFIVQARLQEEKP
jgi:sortase A